MRHSRRSTKWVSRASAFVILLSNIINPAHAQATPQSVGAAAFTRIGTNFYIQGGSLYGDNLIQSFWSLDLSSAWNTSNPAWTSLPPGPYNGFHSAGHSSDNSTLCTFGRDTAASASQIAPAWLNNYDIPSKTWSTLNPPALTDNSRRDFTAVTNPTANRVYILGGDGGSAGSTMSNAFNVYDPATEGLTETTVTAGPQNAVTYGAVWAPRLSNMLVIGGGSNSSSLWTYTPTTATWATQTTTGGFSYARSSHCAASNADGSLVAVFGGFVGGSGIADPNAYVLNTATWTWTTVPYAARGRGNAACTVVDNIFMVWGGFYTNPSVSGGVPTGAESLLLLNLQNLQWLVNYTPSSAMASAGNSGNGGSGDSRGLSPGVIGAIVGVAVAILVVSAWARFDRKRRRQQRHEKVPLQDSELGQYPAPGTGGNGAAPGYEHEGGGGEGIRYSQAIPAAAAAAATSAYAAQQQQQYALQQQQAQFPQEQYEQLPLPQEQYQNQFYQPSPNVTASIYSPPMFEPAVVYDGYGNAEEKSTAGSQYGGRSSIQGYPSPLSTSGEGPVATIYYPPPPVSVASSSEPFEKGSATVAGAPQATPYGYHDSFGMKHDVSAVDGNNKRVSAPQGGQGYGTADQAAALGAPQAILPK